MVTVISSSVQSSLASATTAAVVTFSTRAAAFIASFGHTSMAVSHEARTSITATSTWQTISRTIWSASPRTSICPITGGCKLERRRPISLSTLNRQPLSGMHRMPVGNGIGNTLRAIVRLSSAASQRCVKAVAPALMASQTAAVSVPMLASPRTAAKCGSMMWNVSAKDAVIHSEPISSHSRSIVRWPAYQTQGNISALSLLQRATTVALGLWRKTRAPSGVLTVVGAPTIAGRQRVYNISVEQAERVLRQRRARS